MGQTKLPGYRDSRLTCMEAFDSANRDWPAIVYPQDHNGETTCTL